MATPSPTPPAKDRLRTFVEERTGFVSFLEGWAGLRLPAGPRWGYSLGAALVVLLALQIVTGVALTLFYSPSIATAWASVAYLEREVPFGALVRALHFHGTNAILVVIALHLLHVVLTAGYRRPREFTWWFGLALLGLVLGHAMTGALLPFDDQGYWASRVEIGIMGTVPVVGGQIQQVALGGNDIGNLTLTRYFGLHAIVLPSLLIALISAHLVLVRRHGTSAPSLSPPTPPARYWPSQAFRDGALAVVVLIGLFVIASKLGAPLEAPADPSGNYPARPVWYFRPLFELRRHFEGPLEPISTMVIPGLATGFLFSLPFLDRASTLRGRAPYVGAVIVGLLLALWAGNASFQRDARNRKYVAQQADAKDRANRARLAARDGVPPEGALAMLHNTPQSKGERLFAERCLGCHPVSGVGTDKPKGPDLGGYGSEAWIAGTIKHPEAPEYFGHTKVSGMDPYEKLAPEKIVQLSRMLADLRKFPNMAPEKLPPSFKAGLGLFDSEGCGSCHSLNPGEASGGPNLSGYGSPDWLVGLMLQPADETYFGNDNDMPSYRGKLTDQNLHDVVTYLDSLREKPVQYGSAVTARNDDDAP